MISCGDRVLLIDRAPSSSVVHRVADVLEQAGFFVRVAGEGEDVGEIADRVRPDVTVLPTAPRWPDEVGDVGDVGVDPLADEPIDPTTPVLIVEDEPARDLRDGVTIWLPMSPDEGMERLHDILDGDPREELPTLTAGDIEIDEAGRQAARAGRPLDLTRREFDLLAYLVRHRNRVLTKEALQDSVWRDVAVTPNAIEAQVSKLRAKLEANGPRVIHTLRGVGYVLRVDGKTPLDLRRRALLAERDRLLRQREAMVARRLEIQRSRQEGHGAPLPARHEVL